MRTRCRKHLMIHDYFYSDNCRLNALHTPWHSQRNRLQRHIQGTIPFLFSYCLLHDNVESTDAGSNTLGLLYVICSILPQRVQRKGISVLHLYKSFEVTCNSNTAEERKENNSNSTFNFMQIVCKVQNFRYVQWFPYFEK